MTTTNDTTTATLDLTTARVWRYSGTGTPISGPRSVRVTPESIAIAESGRISRQPPGAFTVVRIHDEEWIIDEDGSRRIER